MENKNYRFVSFLPDAQKKIPKKLKKLKNAIVDSFQAKIGWRMMRKRENKIILPLRSYPTRNKKFPEKQENNSKNKKNTIMASFQSKKGWRTSRKRDDENYRSDLFLTDP